MTATRAGLRARAAALRIELEGALSADESRWLAEVPVVEMAEALRASADPDDHTAVSAEAEALDGAVALAGVDGDVGAYYRLVLLELVAHTLAQPPSDRLPPALEAELLRDMERMLDEAADKHTWPDPLTHGDFLLDVALARGTTLPLGMSIISPSPDGTVVCHMRPGATMTRETFSKALVDAAGFLELNPRYHTVRGAGWLSDPALEQVSPHLAWVREALLAGGAELRPVGTADHVVANATETSKTRRRLYEEGRYQPTAYELVISREDILRWAAATA